MDPCRHTTCERQLHVHSRFCDRIDSEISVPAARCTLINPVTGLALLHWPAPIDARSRRVPAVHVCPSTPGISISMPVKCGPRLP